MAQDDERELTTRNFAIFKDQEAMLMLFGKEQDRSVSWSLRFVLDDWKRLKQTALEAARQVEAVPA